MRGSRTMKSIGPVIVAALFAAGCDRAPDIEMPEAPEATTPDPSSSPISILRETPDAAVDEEELLEPLEVTVPFAEGGFELDEAAQKVLTDAIASDQFEAGGKIVLRGHTDSVGNDEANLRASRKRAETVADALEEAGANTDNIEIIPLGEQRPIAPNAKLDGTPDEEGRARNRRVDITIMPPEDDTQTETEGDEAVVPEQTPEA